jgi:putative ABC transport system permease protein
VPLTLFNTADAGYFAAMRIPLREGRAFIPSDRTGPPVTIVNETLARKWWPKQRAVGQRIKFGGPYREGKVFEIVGVAGDVSQMGLDAAPEPEMYFPFVQSPSPAMVLMVRTAADPGPLMPAVRRRVAGIDRNLPIQNLQPFTESLAAPLARRRFITLLLASFASLAMLLAAVGVYGLFSYWVRVREDEIAIRLALGAPRRAIFGWAGSQALRLSLAGAGLGLLAVWPASRWLESQVFGVSPRDAANLIAAAVAVLAMAMVAAALPMWRAARLDAARHLHRA